MALFNHLFPYSNLHDINLDWIISIIESIDPAVIQALQELTPDIIEQVTQKVAEAQAAAIAAQSSASEANTAKETAVASAAEAAQEAIEASADAALANADAVRAEAAKTAVENSILPSDIQPTTTDYINQITAKSIRRSGNIVAISITGQLSNKAASSEYWTTLLNIPGISLPNDATFSIALEGTIQDASVSTTGDIRLVSSAITGAEKYFTAHVTIVTN